MSDTLLKWVAEELLGFEKTGDLNNLIYRHPTRHGAYGVWKIKLDDLQSWHGIGLVVEEMERLGYPLFVIRKLQTTLLYEASFGAIYSDEKQSNFHNEPWLAVFAAARRAVE